jgi:hypothetical protein
MYRTQADAPRCPACQGTALTPTTKFDPGEGRSSVYFDYTKKGGLFDLDGVHFVCDRARVCLECGHVALSMSKKRLEGLKEELAKLTPVPEDPP